MTLFVPRRVYLAGPLFTKIERDWNAFLARKLRDAGHEVFLPQEHEPRDADDIVLEVFRHDLKGLRQADTVVANLDGPVVDDGTAWECGWAWHAGYPVIGYRTDFRGGEEGAPVNIMLAAGCDVLLEFDSREMNHVGEVVQGIREALREL